MSSRERKVFGDFVYLNTAPPGPSAADRKAVEGLDLTMAGGRTEEDMEEPASQDATPDPTFAALPDDAPRAPFERGLLRLAPRFGWRAIAACRLIWYRVDADVGYRIMPRQEVNPELLARTAREVMPTFMGRFAMISRRELVPRHDWMGPEAWGHMVLAHFSSLAGVGRLKMVTDPRAQMLALRDIAISETAKRFDEAAAQAMGAASGRPDLGYLDLVLSELAAGCAAAAVHEDEELLGRFEAYLPLAAKYPPFIALMDDGMVLLHVCADPRH